MVGAGLADPREAVVCAMATDEVVKAASGILTRERALDEAKHESIKLIRKIEEEARETAEMFNRQRDAAGHEQPPHQPDRINTK